MDVLHIARGRALDLHWKSVELQIGAGERYEGHACWDGGDTRQILRSV